MRKTLENTLAAVGMALSLALAVLFVMHLLGDEPLSDAPIESVSRAVTEAVDLSAMQEGDNQMLRRLYGLDPSEYEGVCLYYPTTNMGAEEILVIRLADVSQQESVAAAMEKRLETQLASFAGYGVEQTHLLENAVVETEGNYVLLAVHGDAQAALAAFRAAL